MNLHGSTWGRDGQAIVVLGERIFVVDLDADTLAGAEVGDKVDGLVVGVDRVPDTDQVTKSSRLRR